MSLAFSEPLLMCTTTCMERVFCLQHYSQVVAVSITLQTNCSLTKSITGFPRTRSVGVAYQDVKEPWYLIAKNAMSVFMLNVLNYITVSRAVCKVYLKQKKESYIQKSDFPFFLLCLFIILAIEHKILRDQIKIFITKTIER